MIIEKKCKNKTTCVEIRFALGKNNKRGITLVALVITIIVMLILAGVAISALVGDGGIISKAQNAADKYNQSAQNEADIINELLNINVNDKIKSDGTWNEIQKVNNPLLLNNMTAVYWEGTPGNYIQHELNNESSQQEWNKWYNYSNKRWANAVTKDTNGNITGYWVWIPRYQYKINEQTIDIEFIKTEQIQETDGYTHIHPSFTTDIDNGGWDKDIPGFWIAKFAAGYQSKTIDEEGNIVNGNEDVKYSNLKYTSVGASYPTNALGQDLTKTNTTLITYPIFRPQTYAFDTISIGDMYSICKEISKSEIHNVTNGDSHLSKLSERGAVAYLTWSKYGTNGKEPYKNNLSIETSNNYIKGVTGFVGNGTDIKKTANMTEVHAYNTKNGVLGSSTQNIYGVYDLNGGMLERNAAYVINGHDNLNIYGSSFANSTTSTKWATVYPYNSQNDEGVSNWEEYSTNYKNSRYGDIAIECLKKINDMQLQSLNGRNASYPSGQHPFFLIGGRSDSIENGTGIFAIGKVTGRPVVGDGFRAVLIGE